VTLNKEMNRMLTTNQDLVYIGSKLHKNISNRSKDELTHLLQLAQIEVDNYKLAIKNYPSDRMEKYGLPHLTDLQSRVDYIQSIITRK